MKRKLPSKCYKNGEISEDNVVKWHNEVVNNQIDRVLEIIRISTKKHFPFNNDNKKISTDLQKSINLLSHQKCSWCDEDVLTHDSEFCFKEKRRIENENK